MQVRGLIGLIAVIIALLLWLLVLLGCSLGVILEDGKATVNITVSVSSPYASRISLGVNASLSTGRSPVLVVRVPLNASAEALPGGLRVNASGDAVAELALPGGNAVLRLGGVASAASIKHALAVMMASNETVNAVVAASTPIGVVRYSTSVLVPTEQYFSRLLRGLVRAAVERLSGSGIAVDGVYVKVESARLLSQRIVAENLTAYEEIEVCVKAEPAPPTPINGTVSIHSVLVDESAAHGVAYTVKPLTVELSPEPSCGVMTLAVPLENVSEAILYAAWILGVQGEYNATLNTYVSLKVLGLPAASIIVPYQLTASTPLTIHTRIYIGKASIPVLLRLDLKSP